MGESGKEGLVLDWEVTDTFAQFSALLDEHTASASSEVSSTGRRRNS